MSEQQEPRAAVDPGIKRLEIELRAARKHGARATKQMHAAVAADLEAAERRARRAERRAADAEARATRAERRARRLERELAEVRSSATWRAGRAVVALPAKVKRLTRR
ncbi:hypothetical protein [Nocardioides deserti]|uniref:DUF3618 domain-containing protein n=1 Tax=Nocardioides deserti TaxID=1588644 RepID=A0ABR6UB90_9ACTN|nr:hypothetical protein [Nocardioides deserti]MBC2961640.1 hypothetical protein [Nocardioides deserti]GGO76842.1 hypothetical protein GCM10012276_30550 [Nocardioides deserti]